MLVTADNIKELMACVPQEQAEDLHPGCETWSISPEGRPPGQITVWPEAGIAAVNWGYGSFWGRWYEGDRIIELDEPVMGYTLIVDESGKLWASLMAEDFRVRMVERFVRRWDLDGLARAAEGKDVLEVIVGCSTLPIFRGREMAQNLLAAVNDPEGPFSEFKPEIN